MPVVTRSQQQQTAVKKASAAAANGRRRRATTGSASQVQDYWKRYNERLGAFTAEFWDHYETTDTPHAWAIRGMALFEKSCPGLRFSSRALYNYMTSFALARLAETPAANTRRRARFVRNMWADWTNWFNAFYDEAKEERNYDQSNLALERWSAFVAKKRRVPLAEVTRWYESAPVEPLMRAIGL